MKAKYAEVADFIIVKYVSQMTDLEQLDGVLTGEQLETLQDKTLTRYLDRMEKTRKDYVKVFGEIEVYGMLT